MTQADDRKEARGKLIIISGPSGVGKSTITREVIDRLEEAYLSVSMTTRPQAPGEQDGHEYWFVSRDEFRRRIEEGLFLEYAEVFGNLYGTPRDKTDEALRAGKTVIGDRRTGRQAGQGDVPAGGDDLHPAPERQGAGGAHGAQGP